MKLGIVYSDGIKALRDIIDYAPEETTEVVCGNVEHTVDDLAAEFALEYGLNLKQFLCDYEMLGQWAEKFRNRKIIEYSDFVLIYWDGNKDLMCHALMDCKSYGKPLKIIVVNNDESEL